MKHLALLILTLCSSVAYSQLSQDLIPKDAVTVLSINNLSVFQKVSLDELIQYDFMIDIQQELFDGSTSGKSIKDAGIDFEQKLNIFYGKTFDYEISGFTFGISDEQKFFEAFDDFEKEESIYPNIQYYSSYFNRLIIKGKSGLLIRVEPINDRIVEVTDSLWYARGNDYYMGAYDNDYMIDNVENNILDVETEEVINQEQIFKDTVSGTEEPVFEEVKDIVSGKTYWELRDSIFVSLQITYLEDLLNGMFINNENLISYDNRFAKQINNQSDGIFYLDNSRNFEKNQSFWYLRTMLPGLFNELKDLYTGNLIIGDIFLNENNIEFKATSNYGDKLGTVYQQLNDTKFDSNILKYIHKNNSSFFTYNVNLRSAYEKAYEVIVPILDKEDDEEVAFSLLLLDILNEYINKDALFGSVKGSLFGTFNGIKKVKTKKIIFDYDEDTFEYSEQEVEAEEDMPIFTLGFSTAKSDVLDRLLYRVKRIRKDMQQKDGYWVVNNAILNAAPLYLINKNGLFIFTNDEDLALNHNNGYNADAISGKKAKEIKSNGFMYAEVDWGTTIDKLPRDLFSGEQNEIVDAMRGKGGFMKLTSSKTSRKNTKFNLVYTFDNKYENSSKYILDFVNSIYLISK
ncbi:MAG: hypothetical protein M9916_04575 [Crocinitomicaceae bacterium]|nr:hypothetical protein [Crocinitomicaceae bacterium]